MATESLEIEATIAAEPRKVYRAWLDPKEHAAMTGAEAAGGGEVQGASFSAWDGYIQGKNLALGPGLKVVQSWRTTEFPAEAPDSRLELHFDQAPGGTRLTLIHTEIPEGQSAQYADGWMEFYLTPMKRYFAPSAPAKAKAAPKKTAKKVVKKAKAPAKKVAPKKVKAPAKKSAPKKSAAKKVAKKPAKKSPAKKRR